jgi:hypothetical protein
VSIDTLEYAKELEAAGLSRDEAGAHVRALRKAVEVELVTKAHFDAKLAELETKLIKYMVAQGVGIVGLVLAVGGLMMRIFR